MPNMRAETQDRERVASVILKRRTELGMTQEQLSQTSGVSIRTVQNAESAESILSPVVRTKLEKALRYPNGFLTEVYMNERAASQDGHHELLGPEITRILNHPGLSPQMRRAVVEQLHKVHEDFAQRAAQFFGLDGSRHTDEGD